jgi:hypothetical protein
LENPAREMSWSWVGVHGQGRRLVLALPPQPHDANGRAVPTLSRRRSCCCRREGKHEDERDRSTGALHVRGGQAQALRRTPSLLQNCSSDKLRSRATSRCRLCSAVQKAWMAACVRLRERWFDLRPMFQEHVYNSDQRSREAKPTGKNRNFSPGDTAGTHTSA